MPMQRELYPVNWPEISRRIRARDGQKCTECGVRNGAVGYRDSEGFHEVFNANDEPSLEVDVICDDLEAEGKKLIKIVLTVAHLNNVPMDCQDSNLKSMCQKCHLNYDQKLHQTNAARTRHLKKVAAGQIELFEESGR